MPKNLNQEKTTLIAIDTGGTFTDFFLQTSQGPITHKVLSTPRDPSLAIQKGLRDLKFKDSFEIIHGSTVATNAFLERKGATVALVTTAGFEDLLEIGRQNRPSLYDFKTTGIPVLVPRRFRYGILERINARGKIQHPLTSKEILKLKTKLKKLSIDSVAICLLFSYANPGHEEKLQTEFRSLKKPISLSSETCPEYREYERTSTTCINAYVAPIMAKYLGRLQKRVSQKVRIMQSNGGSLSIAEASKETVRTLLSGPAGGVLGAFQIAKKAGHTKVLTLDMGGTSTDMSLIDGEVELTSETKLGGLPLKTPMIRIDTIGAGGGSLAWVDKGGALRVGPQSAGAEPGPICYGRGGREMTITDAHVFLGRLPPDHFLGGKMSLYPKKIRPALSSLAKRLKLTPQKTADGIITVANANMTRALRVLSLERGYDPRDFTLLPFGGAGALHACELADQLGIPRVLVPTHPGILSAFGMAHADWVRDYVMTVLTLEKKIDLNWLEKKFDFLKKKGWRDARNQGYSKSEVQFQPALDLRYQGQSFEITVKMSPRFKKDFESAHRKQYRFLHKGRPLEIVNLRLQARVRLSHRIKQKESSGLKKKKIIPLGAIKLHWNGKNYQAFIFDRQEIIPTCKIKGPAIITEYSATTFVPPGWILRCDKHFNLIIGRK